MKPVIETHDLCKSYNGRTVVDHRDYVYKQSGKRTQRAARADARAGGP